MKCDKCNNEFSGIELTPISLLGFDIQYICHVCYKKYSDNKCATIEVKDTEKLELKHAALERYCDMIEDDKDELVKILKMANDVINTIAPSNSIFQGHRETIKKTVEKYEASNGKKQT